MHRPASALRLPPQLPALLLLQRHAPGSALLSRKSHPACCLLLLLAAQIVMTLMLHHNPGCIKALFTRGGGQQGRSEQEQREYWGVLAVSRRAGRGGRGAWGWGAKQIGLCKGVVGLGGRRAGVGCKSLGPQAPVHAEEPGGTARS